jgi:hypothetical protein
MHDKSDGFPALSLGLVLATLGLSACGGSGTLPEEFLTEMCNELQVGLISGASKDGIPSLTDPEMVPVDHHRANYLLSTDRVIGLQVDGEYLAFPHNILWWHEIINLNKLGLAITYCPLTGSSMVFKRDAADGAEFGVSGFLFQNNLVMYDRARNGTTETLWPQMLGGARCGPGEGQDLGMVPALEIEWADWVALHPDTRVVGDDTGHSRDYRRYPYGDYEFESNSLTLFAQQAHDTRRPPKERVLGIPFADGGGIAFPFGTLRDIGDLAVVHESGAGGEAIVVFWDSAARAAMAYRTGALGLRFEVTDGAFVDVGTGSQWSLEGEALSGPLAGQRLEAVPEAYVSFWFAFSTFFDNAKLWSP